VVIVRDNVLPTLLRWYAVYASSLRRRVVEELVKCHWVLAEFIEMVLVVAERDSQCLCHELRKLDAVLQIREASVAVGFAQSLRPDVRPQTELASLHLWVFRGQLAADVEALFQVRMLVAFPSLGVRLLVSTVILVLALVKREFLFGREVKEAFGGGKGGLLHIFGNSVVDDLEEALCHARVANLLGALLLPGWVAGSEIAEVNDRGSLCGRRHGIAEDVLEDALKSN